MATRQEPPECWCCATTVVRRGGRWSGGGVLAKTRTVSRPLAFRSRCRAWAPGTRSQGHSHCSSQPPSRAFPCRPGTHLVWPMEAACTRLCVQHLSTYKPHPEGRAHGPEGRVHVPVCQCASVGVSAHRIDTCLSVLRGLHPHRREDKYTAAQRHVLKQINERGKE